MPTVTLTPLTSRARSLFAGGVGAALGAATAAVAAVRRAPKPLHPRGEVMGAQLRRFGAQPMTGVPWLDDQGSDRVVVRRSRSVGFPPGWPDIHGIALRVPVADADFGDLLFASTGLGPISRFVFTFSTTPYGRPLTTILPYRTPSGPLLLAAVAVQGDSYQLLCAPMRGPWRPFADLTLDTNTAPDEPVSFDPLVNTLPGLDNFEWVDRLREPAYLVARHSRSEV